MIDHTDGVYSISGDLFILCIEEMVAGKMRNAEAGLAVAKGFKRAMYTLHFVKFIHQTVNR